MLPLPLCLCGHGRLRGRERGRFTQILSGMVYKRKYSDRQGPEEQTQGHEPGRAGKGRIQNPLLWGIRETLLVVVFVCDLGVCVFVCVKYICACVCVCVCVSYRPVSFRHDWNSPSTHVP